MAKTDLSTHATRVALVGEETLLGREIEEVLQRCKTVQITAYSATGEGTFGEREGEAIYVDPLDEQAIANHDAIVIAGSTEGAQKAYTLVKAAARRPKVIDCTSYLESRPEAKIVAPLLGGTNEKSRWLLVVAQPAASALALVLTRLAMFRPIKQSVVEIFEPASESGKRGAEELHKQTTDLLSFRSLEKSFFDAQLSFNLLAQYGKEAPESLAEVEQRIERHAATIVSDEHASAVPMPSLRLIQAPTFHGYSISLWVEFEAALHGKPLSATELGEALASVQIEVRGPDEDAPTNVGASGQSGLIAGDIRVDRNNPRAAWFWVVADNLRLTADAAAHLVGGLTRNFRASTS